MTNATSQAILKESLFKTAVATVSCAWCKAGEHVAVEFYGFHDGQAWYLLTANESGKIPQQVAYPTAHLSRFCL